MSRTRRHQRLMDEMFYLAFTAERDEAQLSAAVAWLDRHEGKPVARSIAASSAALAALNDAALAALIADLASQARASLPGKDL